MMVSLFSVFDPVIMGMSFNWISTVMVFGLIPLSYYKFWSNLLSMYSFLIGSVKSVLKEISFPNFSGVLAVSVMLFVFISLNNSYGLMPFIFVSTGHLSVTFSIGLVMWFSFFIMGWVKNFDESSAHLVPEGSPLFLSPFMVIIESVSHFIRPVTLSVRLAANMMAGHLIMGLISSISYFSFSMFIISVFMQSMLLILEWAVVFIQAFVFSVLVLLYALEYY